MTSRFSKWLIVFVVLALVAAVVGWKRSLESDSGRQKRVAATPASLAQERNPASAAVPQPRVAERPNIHSDSNIRPTPSEAALKANDIDVTAPAGTPVSEPLAAPADAATLAGELENVRVMVREFRDILGENPVGTNEEITRALLGDNSKQVRIAVPAGSKVNDEGELVDRWGTPYFFHQLSAQEMEVRSAGPDKRMWTGDDRMTK